MEIDYTDLLIIGAGPAGCSIARSLKNENIILIDKNKLPRDKPCSGLLVEESKEILYALGMPKNVFGNPPELDLENIDLDNNIDIVQKRALGNTDRIKLDQWLAKLIGKNVNLMENTTVTKIEPNGSEINVYVVKDGKERIITSKNVVGADGATSTTRRLLGVRPVRRYRAAQNFIKTNKEVVNCKFIYWNELTDWYAWMLPKEHNIVEIGGAFRLKMDRDIALNSLMEKMNLNGEIVKKTNWLLSRPSKISDIHLGNNKNIFLVGEAAGLISPSTGEGISFGLRSGSIFADAFKSGETFPNYYEKLQPLLNELNKKISKAKALSNPVERAKLLTN